MRSQALFLVSVVGVLACSPARRSPAPDSCVTGTVRVRGPTEAVSTWLVADQREVQLVGGVSSQIRQLGGAMLEVCGEITGDKLTPATYELRRMAGRPAWSGTLESSGDDWYLVTPSERFLLRLPPSSDLPRQEGQRAWVAGVLDGGVVQVESYGFIR